jgi:hypothetical protein
VSRCGASGRAFTPTAVGRARGTFITRLSPDDHNDDHHDNGKHGGD